MTGAAILGDNVFPVGDNQGHVCLVTTAAASGDHGIRVRQMAVLARLNLPVKSMAGRAGQSAVHAGIGPQLFLLPCMTSQARGGQIPGKTYFQRLMRIGMAADAAGQGKMVFIPMTAAAGRDNLHVSRRMALMALHAERLMGLALELQGQHDRLMALGAILGPDPGMHGFAPLAPGLAGQ